MRLNFQAIFGFSHCVGMIRRISMFISNRKGRTMLTWGREPGDGDEDAA